MADKGSKTHFDSTSSKAHTDNFVRYPQTLYISKQDDDNGDSNKSSNCSNCVLTIYTAPECDKIFTAFTGAIFLTNTQQSENHLIL